MGEFSIISSELPCCWVRPGCTGLRTSLNLRGRATEHWSLLRIQTCWSPFFMLISITILFEKSYSPNSTVIDVQYRSARMLIGRSKIWFCSVEILKLCTKKYLSRFRKFRRWIVLHPKRKETFTWSWMSLCCYSFASSAASMICCTREAMLDGSGCNPSTSKALS